MLKCDFGLGGDIQNLKEIVLRIGHLQVTGHGVTVILFALALK
jgi:hypothetical protein